MPVKSLGLSLLLLVMASYAGWCRWSALAVLALTLVRMPIAPVSLATGLLGGLAAWSLLPWIHPDWMVAAYLSFLGISLIRSLLLRWASLISVSAILMAIAPKIIQPPGPLFTAYLRARPAVLDAYHPSGRIAEPEPRPGWIWREKSDGEYFLATSEGWISDGGRLIQNPAIRITRAALEAARESEGAAATVQVHAFLTSDFCRAFQDDFRSGRLLAYQPIPIGRTPECESLPARKPSTPTVQIFMQPFESEAVLDSRSAFVWKCGLHRDPGANVVRFRQMNCSINGRGENVGRILKTRPLQRAKLLWPEGEGRG